MLVETSQIMPITQLQKTLTQTVRKISEDHKPVSIMKDNIMEAVMIPFDETAREKTRIFLRKENPEKLRHVQLVLHMAQCFYALKAVLPHSL